MAEALPVDYCAGNASSPDMTADLQYTYTAVIEGTGDMTVPEFSGRSISNLLGANQLYLRISKGKTGFSRYLISLILFFLMLLLPVCVQYERYGRIYKKDSLNRTVLFIHNIDGKK